MALLDYLGSDYKNAVQDGKIVNQDEFTEMQEFSKRTLELLKQLKETDKADKAGVEPSLKSLANQIENKADPKAVAELANGAKQKLIATYNIVPYPKQLPSLASGQNNLFGELRTVPRRDRQGRRSKSRHDEPQKSRARQFYRCGIHGRALSFQGF